MDSPTVNVEFKRSFIIGREITVEDEITGDMDELSILSKQSPITVPSSQYFQKQELSSANTDVLKNRNHVVISRVLGTQGVSLRVS